ncbi:rhodanese-like domain-containing protein [Halobellus sp. Atlit-31R]|nr:rhodanese-like domain-containing protein [Halobellus sp. Atlit-31R]
MSTIRPAELDDRLESGSTDDLLVLDIRPRDAYRTDSIDGSRNLPVYDALRGGDEAALRDRLDEVPADREVVVVCKQGMIAKRATSLLRDEGYDAATLLGGMGGWNGYLNGSLGYKIRSLVWKLS